MSISLRHCRSAQSSQKSAQLSQKYSNFKKSLKRAETSDLQKALLDAFAHVNGSSQESNFRHRYFIMQSVRSSTMFSQYFGKDNFMQFPLSKKWPSLQSVSDNAILYLVVFDSHILERSTGMPAHEIVLLESDGILDSLVLHRVSAAEEFYVMATDVPKPFVAPLLSELYHELQCKFRFISLYAWQIKGIKSH